MRRLRDIPLRSKLTLIIMMTSTATALLVILGLVANDITNMRRTMAEDLGTLADIVGANSAAAIVFGDTRSVQETLGFLHSQPHVLSAAIAGPEGGPLGRYTQEDGVLPHRATPALPSPGPSWGRHIEVKQDIVLDGEKIGTVHLRSDLSQLHQRLRWYAGIVGLVLVLSLLLAYALSAALQRVVTRPILRLADTARAVSSDKNYSLRAPPGGGDEIGVLIGSFNGMLSEIQVRDTELEHHQKHLQEMVSLRTAELEAANSKLQLAKEQAEMAAERMTHQAYHDALTELPNRALLNDRLIVALAHAPREHCKLALLFLDLDRFKVINDSLGHAVGDRLLVQVARRLEHCVRREDTVARLGGDEFMVLLSSIQEPNDAGRVAQKIIDTLSEPLNCDGQELHVTTSIGISIYPDDGTDGGMLMKNADMCLYRAKDRGRNNYQFWTADMDAASHQRLTMENELRKALERGEISVHYQPKVAVASGIVTGAEALARWHHPQLGEVPPARFIPLAEETGLICAIGEWVLRTACAQARRWSDAGHPLRIAVNLSANQFLQGDLSGMVARALSESGLEPARLELEITESVVMQNRETSMAALREFKNMGTHIAIDDFGTGFSSLSYISRFPVDTVKIDRSFVSKLTVVEEDASIAKAIIAMAHSLRLEVVAEGVEEEDQLRFLEDHGCDTVQGYLYGRPVAAPEFDAFLAARQASRGAPVASSGDT